MGSIHQEHIRESQNTRSKNSPERRNKQIHNSRWGFQPISLFDWASIKKASKDCIKLKQLCKPTGPNWIYITSHYQGYIKPSRPFKKCTPFWERDALNSFSVKGKENKNQSAV